MINSRVSRLLPLGALTIVSILVYFPGLNGTFLLDDHPNLQSLQMVKNTGIASFVFDGVSSTLGRPLSLLSFALQHEDWPDNPRAFKQVNLLIHLLVGGLIYLVAIRLTQHLTLSTTQRYLLALTSTALWLLHPMQVSTVLYTVQRMTQLSSLFTLAGIWGYLVSREVFSRGVIKRGLLGMSLAVGLGISFGVLSKENGILLPLYIIVIEATLFRKADRPFTWRVWAWSFLALPLVLLAGYLALKFGGTLIGFERRDFSMDERLLTQGVILFHYLGGLLLPHPAAFTLFHDDFPVSTGLLSPPVTAFALFGITGMITAAWLFRRRAPVISFGILWFFAGHLLESSFLNLELYFEHRNYLPSLGPLFAVAWSIIKLHERLKWKWLSPALAFAYFSLILAITAMTTHLWGTPLLQFVRWADVHPLSFRAQEEKGLAYLRLGHISEGERVFDEMKKRSPEELAPRLKKLFIQSCLKEEPLTPMQWHELQEKASSVRWQGFTPVGELDGITQLILKKKCEAIDKERFVALVQTLANNPSYVRQVSNLYQIAFPLYLDLGYVVSGLNTLQKAYDLDHKPYLLLRKIEILDALGQTRYAKSTLDEMQRLLAQKPRYWLTYRRQYEQWAAKLNH